MCEAEYTTLSLANRKIILDAHGFDYLVNKNILAFLSTDYKFVIEIIDATKYIDLVSQFRRGKLRIDHSLLLHILRMENVADIGIKFLP